MALGQGAIFSFQAGQLGSDFLADTNEHTGEWGAIQCISAATFTTLTSDNMSGALETMTLSAGITILGHFSVIKLASGSVIAYKV